MNNRFIQIWKSAGPIFLSALSLFLAFFLLQPFALWLNPEWTLRASRDVGKVAFVVMVIYQVVLLLSIQSRDFLHRFFQTNLFFFIEKGWFKKYLKFFSVFFLLHMLIILGLYFAGYVYFDASWGALSISLVGRIFFGFFVAFLLAWTEELIFRGTLFPYFEQTFSTFASLLITSFIFMFAHDVAAPWKMVTDNLSIGIGLFLLGFLLNVVFAVTQKLYIGMGIHSGLVAVKVFFRRVPCLKFVDSSLWGTLVNSDLRQSIIIHFLFLLLIVVLLVKYRRLLFKMA
jgi:membrane protease YdiL (CAAX protease family)